MHKNKIKELRNIIGLTQKEFAEIVGVSHQTVVSWERKTNPSNLTRKKARKIRQATGADETTVFTDSTAILAWTKEPYTRLHYETWRHLCFARRHSDFGKGEFKCLGPWLELMFIAASKSNEKNLDQLGSLSAELREWMEQTVKKYELVPIMENILAQRMKEEELSLETLRGLGPMNPFDWTDSPDYKPGQKFKVKLKAKWDLDILQVCPPAQPGTD